MLYAMEEIHRNTVCAQYAFYTHTSTNVLSCIEYCLMAYGYVYGAQGTGCKIHFFFDIYFNFTRLFFLYVNIKYDFRPRIPYEYELH